MGTSTPDADYDVVERDELILGEVIDWSERSKNTISFNDADYTDYDAISFETAEEAFRSGYLETERINERPPVSEMLRFASGRLDKHQYKDDLEVCFGGMVVGPSGRSEPNVYLDEIVFTGNTPVEMLYDVIEFLPRPSETDFEQPEVVDGSRTGGRLRIWWD